ncbi:MAG: HD domain-containing protein [Treponema sp.]|nr:HD domain-containing protein [Candidatus Treponema caballi]
MKKGEDFTESNDFFKKNEREQNRVVMRILFYTPLAGLAMVIGGLAGVFTGSLKIYLTMMILQIIQSLLMKIFYVRNPEHPALKYYVVLTTELGIFILSISKGFSPFIIYAMAPLISCLYFNRNFCFFTSGVSYVAMLISIIIRAMPDNPLGEGLSSLQWGLEYGIGLTLEFVLNIGVLNLVTIRHMDVLNSNLDAIKKFRVTQDELITSYAELISRSHQSRTVSIKRGQAVAAMLCEILEDHAEYPQLKDEDIVNAIVLSYPLHDIGLIGVPDAIVKKNTTFTAAEKKEYERHVAIGEELIRKNFYMSENREFLKTARLSALHHHERWDGTGYPEGLMGPAIPLCARIVAIADELEHWVSGDNQNTSVSFETALLHIQKQAGTAFDPVIVEALLSSRISLEQLYACAQSIEDGED